MLSQRADIVLHLLSALVAGGAVGIERSYHGRPAGFRTHTLVCLASCLLMLLSVNVPAWFTYPLGEAVRMDPTRMAQGIVTGIGFLGAGVIFKEGLTVRGLTTAASIWMTSAIGTLIGVGLFFPASFATVLTLGVLTVFRRLELMLPVQFVAHYRVRFDRSDVMAEERLRGMLGELGFRVSGMSYRLVGDGKYFEYRMVIRTDEARNVSRLALHVSTLPTVREFAISPGAD